MHSESSCEVIDSVDSVTDQDEAEYMSQLEICGLANGACVGNSKGGSIRSFWRGAFIDVC